MKTKLIGIIKRSIIESARRTAKNLYQLFEEIFQERKFNEIKTEPQRAAERLLQKLEKSQSIKSKGDKELIKSHVKRKFA